MNDDTMRTDETWGKLAKDAARGLWLPMLMAAGLIGIELINTVLMHKLNVFGVHPRDPLGLVGIVAMPFLHGSWSHVIGNSIALVLFGSTMMLMRSPREMFFVTVFTGLVAGAFVWLVGRDHSVHVGYSGVLFGYFGYLLTIGFFERKMGAVILSITFAMVYGTMIFGVLPGQPGVSWEGHLGGFLAGLIAAFMTAKKTRKQKT